MTPSPDPDLKVIYDWLIDFIETADWIARKDNIEKYLVSITGEKDTLPKNIELLPIAIYEDRIGWYLYLLEKLLYDPYSYEYAQGARIIPFFKRLGLDFKTLTKIAGLNKRVRKLIHDDRNTPDNAIFEITTALLWARNGWEVSFIEEDPPHKKPDLKATKNGIEWQIECKRLSQMSEYSLKERDIWLSMWNPFVDKLIDNKLSLLLDITFHTELNKLTNEFLITNLFEKLRLITQPCIVIDDEICKISVEFIDYERIKGHLNKYSVKEPSPQLKELISGQPDIGGGFTFAYLGSHVTAGSGKALNRYVEDISFAVGAHWRCNAEAAIEKKARDIRKRLSEATEQLPTDTNCAIHVGLETYDGWLVERSRYEKIFSTVRKFDSNNKNLERVYCHLFQSYAPLDQTWVMDETVYFFNNPNSKTKNPLDFIGMITPELDFQEGAHWLLDPP